jgi:hypothetical protein
MVHAVALHDVHPVQAERASTWTGRGVGRGAAPSKSARASHAPSRTSTARIFWAEETMIEGGCRVCDRRAPGPECAYLCTIPRDGGRRQRCRD